MIQEILNKHSHILADLADSVGINYDAIRPHLHQQTGRVPITRGIHKSKQYRGKVYCFINHFEVKGEKYPVITFGTHKHGGIVESYNGYREHMASRGYSDAYIQKQEPKQLRQVYVAPIDLLEKWQIDALNDARTAFDFATNENVSTHDYVISKGLNIDGCDIRRVVGGKFDNCLLIAIKDSTGIVIGYQSIDSKGKKKFIGRVRTGAIVIGDKSKIPFGAIFCEGLATGLKIYHSNSAAKNELKNNRQMPVIVCLSADNMRNVVASYLAEYNSKNFQIYADNDCGKNHGNTGIFVALEVCKQNYIEKYHAPVSTDGAACDFADTLRFNDFTVPKKLTDYSAALLEVCPKQSIKKYWQRYACALIENAPSELRSVDDCVESIVAITELRGIDVKNDAHEFISRKFKQRLNAIRKSKTITDFEGVERWNVDGRTPAEVAELITLNNRYTETIHFDIRGMGGNKTNTMIERATHLTGGICYISPLISVCKNAGGRLNFYDYQSTSTDFVNTYSHHVNLSVCINSIEKYNIAENFSHIFIDEAVAVYASIFDDAGTNSTQQKKLIEVLRVAFKSAKSVLIADAGLSDREVAFFKSLAGEKKIHLIETTSKRSDKNHWLLENHAHSREFILRDVRAGKRGVVATDTVPNAIATRDYLVANGIDSDRILLLTGENNGEENVSDFIEKPNDNAYRYDVIIHSPIIKSGTSIEFADYSFTYLLYDGVVGTSDAMQMLGRNRCATDVYVSFGNLNDKSRVTDFELLLKADIESHHNQGYVLADRTLAKLRHEFTATKNADLNDFKNNLILFAEITGRNFARIESDIKIDKKLSAQVKASRVEDRLNAKVLTETEYQSIKNSNLRTQAQTDSMKRHETATMVYGASNITSDSVITSQDIENELDGMANILDTFEFISKDTSELKTLDTIDSHNGTLKFSRVELQKTLIDVLAPLQKASEGGGIDKKTFNKTCDKLEKHALILALAGLGNFKKLNRIRAGATVGNLMKKLGYEMSIKTITIGVKKYQIKPNDDISRYAMNRKGCS